MAENRKSQYEGMFLLTQAAMMELGAAVDHIREIIARADGEIIAMKKWDERRFAYEIRKQKRGAYILVYFECPSRNITGMERDCNLSEQILRVLITRADHLTIEEMQAADGQKELATEAELRRERAMTDDTADDDNDHRRDVEEEDEEEAAALRDEM